MAVLKKLRASTLMETLVATILIVLVFMLSSMLLNSILTNTVGQNDELVRQEFLLLKYRYEHGTLPLPYYAELEHWEIAVVENEELNSSGVSFTALHTKTNKEILYQMDHEP
ncbi:hypothetical protein [Flagellimonas algicola]|uniref:Prepilin-type N-terminal cleavage/methylation domain-containing protein n=1 Tax=Flagellimonas algicola TaxID=2583815 RepID=A0ABY2WM18_9FLAO|nr:hypothetical protein [Allomuricauda algicola]TMU55652.1 hypothetical protein FGG15_15920 [Allomuricauda algicola]